MALTEKLSAIGNAIREKTGETDLLTLAQMPEAIASIGGCADTSPYVFSFAKVTQASDSSMFVVDFGNEHFSLSNTEGLYIVNPNWEDQPRLENSNIGAYYGVSQKMTIGSRAPTIYSIYNGKSDYWQNGVALSFSNGVATIGKTGQYFVGGVTYYCFLLTKKDW